VLAWAAFATTGRVAMRMRARSRLRTGASGGIDAVRFPPAYRVRAAAATRSHG
jgi:hypothetical protein